jgi:hypothetical protein
MNQRWVSVAACLAGLFITMIACAQQPKQPLLAEHVPTSVLTKAPGSNPTNFTIGTLSTTGALDGEAASRAMKEPKQKLTRGERWEKFEDEYGIHQKNPSLVKGSLESAKYRLDKTTFAVNEFVQDVEDALSFDYELRSLGREARAEDSPRSAAPSSIPFWDSVENARLKSDIDLDVPRGRAFVGVRLVLPIGD